MPTDVEASRSRFRRLLTANPNHFGTLTGPFAELYAPVEPKHGDTQYEELGCVSYSPERDRLEATVVIKRSSGYSGGPCTTGSTEWVRFFVDFGGGWVDAGSAATRVFDLPEGRDCTGAPDHPYVHVVGVVLTPRRRFCFTPLLPRVRAILSWEVEPPAGDPDHVPVWGEVQDDTVQVRPRRFPWFGDLVDVLTVDQLDVKALTVALEEHQVPGPVPEPDPVGPVALVQQGALPPAPVLTPYGLGMLTRIYHPEKLRVLAERATDPKVAELVLDEVPVHRFATPEAAAVLATQGSPASLAQQLQTYTQLELDWPKVLDVLDQANGEGNTTYERLECVGLDNTAGHLVATYRVRRPTGFSGPPCSAGSTEYVAFWADFGDDCRYTYLGTAEVSAHDYVTMPADGLSYAAVLPVDVDAYRRLCEERGLHRVRAVLSWGTPPSTTDPDAVPFWGNRLDAHVHVRPGRGYDGTARLTVVGGVATDEIDPATGVTKPVAHLAYNGALLDARGCPFAGRVTVHGPTDPALAHTHYRVLVRDVTAGGTPTPATTPFFVVDEDGHGSWVAPAADGWAEWPEYETNTLGVLGYVDTSSDTLWEVQLEVLGTGVVDTQRVQLDNTLNTASVDPANAAHLAFDPDQLSEQNCGKFTQGMTIHGTFDARDRWLGSWSFGLSPFPIPPLALSTSVSPSTVEAPVGSTWSLETDDLGPCGYVLRLGVADRAIVDSTWTGRSRHVEIGFCLE